MPLCAKKIWNMNWIRTSFHFRDGLTNHHLKIFKTLWPNGSNSEKPPNFSAWRLHTWNVNVPCVICDKLLIGYSAKTKLTKYSKSLYVAPMGSNPELWQALNRLQCPNETLEVEIEPLDRYSTSKEYEILMPHRIFLLDHELLGLLLMIGLWELIE